MITVSDLIQNSMNIRRVVLYTFRGATPPFYEKTIYDGLTVPLLYMNKAKVEHFRALGRNKLVVFCIFEDEAKREIY